jgi:DNA-binding transcriptional LysR family regulator
MGMNVELTTIRYFVHVGTLGSFARGAARAHVSSPAMSKAVRKLEDELGTRLFERTTRRVILTPDGQVALERCRRILADVDALEADVPVGLEHPRGPLRIAAMEVFSAELLPAVLVALVSEHRDVVPSCYEMIPQRMTDRLLDGEVDVGFSIGLTPAAGIELHPLGMSPGVLVCGRRHPLFSRGRIHARDLERYPFVVPRFFGDEHLPSLDQFPEALHPRRVGATIELLQMGVELAAEGELLGYFPEVSVRKQLAAKRLRALKGIPSGRPFQLHALSRAAVPMKPAARMLIARVMSAVKAR